jgi:hypothetical protein
MEERDFYTETEESYPALLNCPHCRQQAEYRIRWAVRAKRASLPPRADERKVRKDDMINCSNPRCRRRFELTGQSVVMS